LNFSKDNTKLVYAAVKLILVLVASVLYLAFGKWGMKMILGIGAA